ncbi:MAG: hypothetical protein ACLGGX_09525 [Bdellovibrionia bacterium]
MKSLKLLIINALTLIIGIGLMSGSFSQRDAQAARFEQIPSLEVKKLGNFRGHYLTVMYGIGSKPFIATDDTQIILNQVKEVRSLVISGDEVKLPPVQVQKEGFRPAYNMILLVVSPQPNFSWVNADGSVPQGLSKTGNRMISKILVINKSDVDQFVSTQGEKSVLSVQF